MVVVQGTTAGFDADLSKGPGHYMNTSFPGMGSTVAIAGHRTTYGAWFRHIDEIRDGDPITLQMPYATFTYRVQMHQVVPNTDWGIIKPQGYERLVLSACHPLYSASHRWVVFARGVSVTLPGKDGRTAVASCTIRRRTRLQAGIAARRCTIYAIDARQLDPRISRPGPGGSPSPAATSATASAAAACTIRCESCASCGCSSMPSSPGSRRQRTA